MTTFVKKQHYVWQYMLQPWTSDGKIACLRQADKAAFITGTTSVANETFFYRNNKLSPQDLMYVESIIRRSRHETLRDLNRETVAMFQQSHELRELAERMPANTPQRTQVEEQLVVIDKTLGESYQTLFEGRARRLVDRLKASDCEFYRDTQDAMEFVNFISHQFTRGPKFLSIAMSLPNPIEGLDLKRTWLVESHIYATNIGFSFLAEKDKYKFLFLNNNSNTPFITGDQALINLNAQTNPDVRMYYPLSPTHAVIYGVDDAIDFCQSRDVDELQAGFLNDRIYAMSVDQIYAVTKAQVESYTGLPKGAYAPSPV